MKYLGLSLAAAAAAFSLNANACAWHGGGYGGGYYGSQWRQYSPDEVEKLIEATYQRNAENDAATEQQQKAKPTFASSAARAVESAKARAAETTSDAGSKDEE